MKTFTNSMTRLERVLKIGTALGATLLSASVLHAQATDPAQPPASTPSTAIEVSHSAKEFLQFASQADQTEIAMADVAEARSQNATVKELAQMMRADHQKDFAQVQLMAQKHMIALDASLNSMNERAVNHLQKVNAANVDRDYTRAMLKDHVKAITTFGKAVAQLDQPDVTQYAQSTLPILRKHLQHSEVAARSAGVDEATITSILKGLPTDEMSRAVTFNQN
jgi:putative membrane protein